MKWKKWLLALVVFAGICWLADFAITRGFLLKNHSMDNYRINRLYHDNSDEIPILGSSKAHGNYNPAAMGLNAYNYGMDGASYDVVDLFLQIELAKSRTTPVILELQLEDTHTVGSPERFINFVSDPRVRDLLHHFHAMEWRYYVPGLRYFGYYDSFAHNYLYFRSSLKESQGFREIVPPEPFNRASLDEFIRKRRLANTGYFPEGDQNQRLLAQITAHPRRLFFIVISPFHPVYYEHFQSQDKLAAFEKQLTTLPNVVLLDWGRRAYPDECYLDTIHLRPEGSTRFSKELGEKIRETLRDRPALAPIPKG